MKLLLLLFKTAKFKLTRETLGHAKYESLA